MIFDFGPTPYFQSPLDAAPAVPGSYVLLAFGQSNMVDQSADDAAVSWPANALVMDTETETYAVGTAPLKWLETEPGATANWQNGPGQLVKHFALEWCAAHPNDTLIVVPCARSGTGFSGEWIANGDGRLYNEAIRLLDQVFVDYPQAGFLAMLGQHGETDGEDDNRVYQWCATEMIAKIRGHYNAPTLPVIWGEPGPAPEFGLTGGTGYDVVRAQIRALPTQLPYVATVREENIATFDALTDLDGLHFDQASQKTLGGLHYDALSTAQANATVPMPAATLIWQTTGEHGWLNYDVPTQGVEAGDTLIILATNHRSSGSPYMTSATVDGAPVTFHVQERVTQGVRIGMTIASITLGTTPSGSTMPVAALWGALPLGGGVSIWRIKGGASLSAGSFGYDTNLGPLSVGLTADLPGTTLMLAYAVDTGAGIAFSGDGTVLTEGPGNTNAAYFTARQSVQAGGAASLALAPSGVPSHACGMVAVAVG